ncbi:MULTISPECIES: hypothetical protein [unclassified Thomasclavelia]|uniref:hypothetical protein n=1 Tax=unclassified Thomasclavelia TaxID=3025756 RepID=UPI0025E1CEA1|nr:hypothetical protein [Thomasclavelia sp.]
MKSVSKNELVKLLSICGQVAKHKSEKLQEHGKDESLILSALSKEKQDQLKSLLEKLQKQWLEDHKKTSSKNTD